MCLLVHLLFNCIKVLAVGFQFHVAEIFRPFADTARGIRFCGTNGRKSRFLIAFEPVQDHLFVRDPVLGNWRTVGVPDGI